MQCKVNEVGGNGAHLPKYPDVNDSDVNPGDEAGAEEFFMIDVAVMDLNYGMVRFIAEVVVEAVNCGAIFVKH